jgi:phosphoglycerol transferase
MRGRPDDEWIRDLSAEPTPDLVRTAALAGYCGIYVDRLGYRDGAGALEKQLHEITNTLPIASEDGLMSFFPLSRYTEALKSGTTPEEWSQLTHAAKPNLLMSPIAGVYGVEVAPSRTFRWCNHEGTLEIVNATGSEQNADLDGFLLSGHTGKGTVWFVAGGHTFEDTATPEGNLFDVPLILKPGDNLVRFHTTLSRISAPVDPRDMYFQMSGLKLDWHPTSEASQQDQPARTGH